MKKKNKLHTLALLLIATIAMTLMAPLSAKAEIANTVCIERCYYIIDASGAETNT